MIPARHAPAGLEDAARDAGGWPEPPLPQNAVERALLAAGHAILTADQRAEFVAAVSALQPAEWPALQGLAVHHALTALLWRHLVGCDLVAAAPDHVAGALRQSYASDLLTQMRLDRVLRESLALCRDAGIHAIPRKGTALGRRIYGQLGPRPSRDVDLFIHPGVSQRHAYAALAPVFARWHARGARVELTWQLIRHPPHRAAFDARAVWRRASAWEYGGVPCALLAPSDEIRYLCAHYVKHQFDRWLWLVDVAELTRRAASDPAWRWEEFAQATIAAGLALPVGLTLTQASALLGAPVPAGTLAALLDAGHAPLERERWAAVTDLWGSQRHYAVMVRAARGAAEKLATLGMLLWPDRAYLYDAGDWEPGQALVGARLRRLGGFARDLTARRG